MTTACLSDSKLKADYVWLLTNLVTVAPSTVLQAIFNAGGLYIVLTHDSVEDSAWAVRNILDKCPHFKKVIFFDKKFLAKLEESFNNPQSDSF